jgi:hypothetical protein
MKKSVNKLVLKTDKVVRLSKNQIQNVIGGAISYSHSCKQTEAYC